MNLKQIRELVEERVQSSLIERLFDSIENSHCKVGYAEGCNCQYCSYKRVITYRIANVGKTNREEAKRLLIPELNLLKQNII